MADVVVALVTRVLEHRAFRSHHRNFRSCGIPANLDSSDSEVDLSAPDTEGLYAWEAKASAAGLDIPHAECIASFGVRVVPTPECLLTVLAIDVES